MEVGNDLINMARQYVNVDWRWILKSKRVDSLPGMVLMMLEEHFGSLKKAVEVY
jgi:hypothetical protein